MNTQAGSSKVVAFPTNTIHSIRLCLFQATRRPEMIEKIIETSFGKIRIKGRVGQAHLDVFESICYSRKRKKDVGERIHILVDPWEVRKRSQQFSGSTLEKLIDDLMQVIIEIIEPEHLACTGHLIDHIDKARDENDSIITKDGPFGKRAIWTVKLGEAFCKLVMKDIWVGWNPEAIVDLDHGISQAVARHALSHKNSPGGGWKIETLIRAVAGEVSDEVQRKYKERIRHDAEKMARIGVLVENGRVKLNKYGDCDA